MTYHPIKVITFDLDDTLWDVAPVLIAAENEVQAWLLENHPTVADRFDTKQLRELRVQLLNEHEHLTHQISQLRIESMIQAFQECGYPKIQASVFSHQAFEVFIHHRHQVEYFDQVEEALEELHQHYTLGVITNGNANIHQLALGKYFSFSFSAEQLNLSKPANAVFNAVLQHTHTEASEVIHVGDHYQHDIEGAQQAGLRTVWANIQNVSWPGDKAADREIRHFSDLVSAIESIAKEALPKKS